MGKLLICRRPANAVFGPEEQANGKQQPIRGHCSLLTAMTAIVPDGKREANSRAILAPSLNPEGCRHLYAGCQKGGSIPGHICGGKFFPGAEGFDL